MAVLAMKCPTVKVIVCDINERQIKRWRSDTLPIYEPGLKEVVKESRGRNLFFSTHTNEEVRGRCWEGLRSEILGTCSKAYQARCQRSQDSCGKVDTTCKNSSFNGKSAQRERT